MDIFSTYLVMSLYLSSHVNKTFNSLVSQLNTNSKLFFFFFFRNPSETKKIRIKTQVAMVPLITTFKKRLTIILYYIITNNQLINV